MPTLRVELPAHLRTLALIPGHEVALDVPAPATMGAVVDALEAEYPALRGTIRDHATGQRRAFLRFFACQQDLSHEPMDAPLPEAVVRGAEPLIILGAVAGGQLSVLSSQQSGHRGTRVEPPRSSQVFF